MKLYIYVVLGLLLGNMACTQKQNAETSKTEAAAEVKPLLEFTNKQLSNVAIVLGKVELQSIAEEVPATGVIDVPPQNMANISTFVQGKVSGINTYPGVAVTQGTILCYLTHPEIIQIQQQYIKAIANAQLAKTELTRQNALNAEEATSTRKVQFAESDNTTAQAEVQSLEAKLKLLGISIAQVKAGNFVSKIPVRASISGFVKEVLVNEGKTVAANDALFTIINPDHLHLELKVYERDSYKIKDGQEISFNVRSQPDVMHKAVIYVAGKNLDAANGTVTIHGHFHEEGSQMMAGSYVNAKINVGKVQKYTLPNNAILHDGNNHEVFVAVAEGGKTKFVKEEIKIGTSASGFTEILNYQQWTNKTIVVKNPDFLEAQLTNSAEEE